MTELERGDSERSKEILSLLSSKMAFNASYHHLFLSALTSDNRNSILMPAYYHQLAPAGNYNSRSSVIALCLVSSIFVLAPIWTSHRIDCKIYHAQLCTEGIFVRD